MLVELELPLQLHSTASKTPGIDAAGPNQTLVAAISKRKKRVHLKTTIINRINYE